LWSQSIIEKEEVAPIVIVDRAKSNMRRVAIRIEVFDWHVIRE
jgi:hypothetical protein